MNDQFMTKYIEKYYFSRFMNEKEKVKEYIRLFGGNMNALNKFAESKMSFNGIVKLSVGF